MRKNRLGFVNIYLALGVLLVGLFLAAVVFGPKIGRGLGLLSLKKDQQETQAAGELNLGKKPAGRIDSSQGTAKISPEPSASSSPSPSPVETVSSTPTVYTQPQGKYSLTMPAGWKFAATESTSTYSTSRFAGSNGWIAITFGSGKDPAGGCSDTTNIQLANRLIAACYILQKDGSQYMTRAYTKDSTGIDFTIEAFFNSPSTTTRPQILPIVKTITIK